MTISMELGERSYDIILERGCLERAGELLKLDRKCLIVTDDGVPKEYAEALAASCREPVIVTLPQGEQSKSMEKLEKLLSAMLENGFTRSDCAMAVGGGMAGDIAGFAAAVYMRGIDFYNIPTTVLSQADSSIGGKTAIDFGGAKNIVGAFWQPKAVLIDPDTLATLPAKQIAAGMAEIVKAGLIADAELFGYIESICAGGGLADPGCSEDIAERLASGKEIEKLLAAALMVKKHVVEADEREAGLRRILNFGHTIGHGIESVTGLLHGECVALGMLPMCSGPVRCRLEAVLDSLGLQTRVDADPELVFEAMLHDKKMKGGSIGAVYVEKPGEAVIREMMPEDLRCGIEGVTRA